MNGPNNTKTTITSRYQGSVNNNGKGSPKEDWVSFMIDLDDFEKGSKRSSIGLSTAFKCLSNTFPCIFSKKQIGKQYLKKAQKEEDSRSFYESFNKKDSGSISREINNFIEGLYEDLTSELENEYDSFRPVDKKRQILNADRKIAEDINKKLKKQADYLYEFYINLKQHFNLQQSMVLKLTIVSFSEKYKTKEFTKKLELNLDQKVCIWENGMGSSLVDDDDNINIIKKDVMLLCQCDDDDQESISSPTELSCVQLLAQIKEERDLNIRQTTETSRRVVPWYQSFDEDYDSRVFGVENVRKVRKAGVISY